MSLADRIEAVLIGMSLVAGGAALDYSKPMVSSSKQGAKLLSFNGAPPLVVEWGRRFERLLLAAERDLEEYRSGVKPVPHDKNGRTDLSGMRERLHEYAGRSNTDVAWIEGCSEDSVQAERAKRGLDHRGFPKPLLTAPTRDTAKLAIPTTEKNHALPEPAADAASGGGAPRGAAS